MKTQKNNFGKLGMIVLASMALVSGSMKAEDMERSGAVISLEIFAEAQEASLRYNAPEVNFEAEAAMVNLENFDTFVNTSLKYVASDFSNAQAKLDEVAPVMESLDEFATVSVSGLKYQAPAEDEAIEAVPAAEKLEMIADAAVSALKYEAPVSAENQIYDITDNTVNDMLAENK